VDLLQLDVDFEWYFQVLSQAVLDYGEVKEKSLPIKVLKISGIHDNAEYYKKKSKSRLVSNEFVKLDGWSSDLRPLHMLQLFSIVLTNGIRCLKPKVEYIPGMLELLQNCKERTATITMTLQFASFRIPPRVNITSGGINTPMLYLYIIMSTDDVTKEAVT
jgi:hypothetical protein